jgi:hypothetical protein
MEHDHYRLLRESGPLNHFQVTLIARSKET